MPSSPDGVPYGEYSKFTDSYEPFVEDIKILDLALKRLHVAYENWQITEKELALLREEKKSERKGKNNTYD